MIEQTELQKFSRDEFERIRVTGAQTGKKSQSSNDCLDENFGSLINHLKKFKQITRSVIKSQTPATENTETAQYHPSNYIAELPT